MPFGVTIEGFVPKRLADVKSELEAQMRAAFGDVNLAPRSVLGQLVGIFSKHAADLWEAAEDVYLSMYPASAEGTSLDNVSALVGITRLGSVPTSVTVQAKGNEGTVLLVGRQVAIPETGAVFASTVEKTITKTAADRFKIVVANAVNGSHYIVTINGTPFDYTAGAGPTIAGIAAAVVALVNAGAQPVTAIDHLDGSFEVLTDDPDSSFNGTVNANLTINEVSTAVPFSALLDGATPAPAGTVVSIVTPVAGWTAATNRVDGDMGRDVETDAELRERRRSSVRVIGAASAESITARLLNDLDGVSSVRIYQNRTNAVDVNGLPAHSFETVIEGGDDTEIAESLWSDLGPAGIETHGTTIKVVKDTNGDNQNVKFTRPAPVYVWVKVTVAAQAEETLPATYAQSIKDSIAAYVAELQVGNDVVQQRLYGPVYETPGIATAVIELATSAGAGGPPGAYAQASVAIGRTAKASFDSTRITVVGP